MNSTPNMHHSSPEHSEYIFGLIGYPLAHSCSPKIHQAALKALNLQGTYHLYPVPADEACYSGLEKRLGQVRLGEIHGLNVTIPHKQTILPFLDDLTPTAAAVGAVNTVFLNENQLIGDNTDVAGFWSDLLENLGFQWLKDAKALILGAGGAARAVVYALLQAGFQITIAARRKIQIEEIELQFPDFKARISWIKWENLNKIKFQPALIVNTTPIGMYPHDNASPWPSDLLLPGNAKLYDLIYNPVETRLVRIARVEGLQTAGGLGMLVKQAALSFERWTGLSAPLEVMMETAYEE